VECPFLSWLHTCAGCVLLTFIESRYGVFNFTG
jgi:hypothetical protein